MLRVHVCLTDGACERAVVADAHIIARYANSATNLNAPLSRRLVFLSVYLYFRVLGLRLMAPRCMSPGDGEARASLWF